MTASASAVFVTELVKCLWQQAWPLPVLITYGPAKLASAIEASLLQAHACGTVYRRTCDET